MKGRRVLYFCSSNLAVIDDGIKKINFNLLKEFLKQGLEVTLIMPLGSGSVISHLPDVKIIFYNKKNSLINKFRSLLLMRPLYFGMYYDRNIFDNVNKLDFDMIFYDFYPLAQYSSGLKNEISCNIGKKRVFFSFNFDNNE